MSELAKLKQLHVVPVSSSSSPQAAAAAAAAAARSEQASSGGQMMMMQQMVNSAADPFLGQSVVAGGPATSGIESHAAQSSTANAADSTLGQYMHTVHCTLAASHGQSMTLCIILSLEEHSENANLQQGSSPTSNVGLYGVCKK